MVSKGESFEKEMDFGGRAVQDELFTVQDLNLDPQRPQSVIQKLLQEIESKAPRLVERERERESKQKATVFGLSQKQTASSTVPNV